MIFRLVVVATWLGLSLLAGTGVSALGAGTLAWPWVLASTALMALFFAPLLAIIPPKPSGRSEKRS